MRIAVFHNLPHGGALRAITDIARRMPEHVTDIYTFADITLPEDMKGVTLHKIDVPMAGFFKRPFGRLNGLVSLANLSRIDKACRKLAAEIDSKGFDLVYVGPCRVCQTPPILKYLKTPAVYHCTEVFRGILDCTVRHKPALTEKGLINNIYIRKAVNNEWAGLKAAKLVFTNSCRTRESILENYGVEARVAYDCVDTDLFKPLNLPKEDFVLSVGRLSDSKGHDRVIDGISLIPKDIRPALRIVCGPTGDEEAAFYTDYAAKKDVNLILEKNISDERLLELYNKAKVTVYEPVLEPLGLVPVESMACGTPVAGAAEGGIRETVKDGENGILTRREPKEIAAAITKLITDTALAEKMGKAGAEYAAECWSWNKNIAERVKIMERIVSESRGGK